MLHVIEVRKPITAYLLATVRTGKEYETLELIRSMKGVKEALITYGLWDLVVKIEVDNLTELDKIISDIRGIEWIERTTTLIGV
ncbi:MAG: AsnC family transcriptional regulator [Thermofilum sp. ex4484_15]|nr:MAG: AsnC family transcriptional regulator [Thermofilum sp. ex4484_15]